MPDYLPRKKRKPISEQPLRNERPTKKAKIGLGEQTASRSTPSTNRSKSWTSTNKSSQPKQQNATPGPSSLSSVAQARSRKRKARSPSPSTDEDSDKTPPSSIIPLPKVAKPSSFQTAAKTIDNAKPKHLPKSRKSASVNSQRVPSVLLDSFSISSDSDHPCPSPPKNRFKSAGQRPIGNQEDIIDLCSDEDQSPISPQRPVRIRMEDDVFIILSSDDEVSSVPVPALSGLGKKDSIRIRSPSSIMGDVLRSPPTVSLEYDTWATPQLAFEAEQTADTSASPKLFQPEGSPAVAEPLVPLQVVYNQALADTAGTNDDDTQVLSPLCPCPSTRQNFAIIYSDTPSHPPIHTPLFFANSIFKRTSRSLASSVNDGPVCPTSDLVASRKTEPKEKEEGLASATLQVPPLHEDNRVESNEGEASSSRTVDVYRQAYVEGLRLKELLAGLRQPTTQPATERGGATTILHSTQTSSPKVPTDIRRAPGPTAHCLPETNKAFATSSPSLLEPVVFDSGLSPHTTQPFSSGHDLKLPAAPSRSTTSPDSNTSKDTSISSLDSLEDSPGPSTPDPTHVSKDITIGCFPDSTLEFDLDLDLFLGKDIEDDDDDVSLSGLELIYPDAPLVG